LKVDPSKRLGCTAIGAEEIKQHPWFFGVDWTNRFQQKYTPPLLPMVESEGDSSNFADYSDQLDYQDVLSGNPVDIQFEGF
jgi:hypothetical protein